MAERKVLVQKCKEMGIQFSTKTRVSVLKENFLTKKEPSISAKLCDLDLK